MKCTILHDTAGRIRVHLEQPRMSLLQADILEAYLRNTPGVADVTVHDRTGNATILYTGQRAPIVAALVGCSLATVWRMARRGTLPAPRKISDRVTVFNVGELRQALSA